jgi:tetratricopeptide (TPR) repeat protein
MAADDEATQKELEREKLIREIRRRAEEAELKRIEDEERRSVELGSSSEPVPTTAPEPPAAPPPTPPVQPEPPPPAPRPQTSDLVEKLDIALDRGLADKAAPMIEALAALEPGHPRLPSFRDRLASLTVHGSTKSRKRSGEGRGDREGKKKIADHLERANGFYQQEKYEQALAEIDGILELQPEHSEALELKALVEKAFALAKQIREEDSRRRAETIARARPAAPAPPTPRDAGSVWGATIASNETQTVFEAPEEKVPEVVRKPSVPLMDRLARRATTVRIPVKALVTAATVIVVGLLVYFVVDAIRSTVFPPKYSLLIFPASAGVTDGSLDYLSEGLTEGLIGDLSAVPDFRLLGPASSMHFLDPRTHTAASARELGVSYFMVWTVDRSDEMIGVRLSLFDTVQAAPLWQEQYSRSFRELPALRREIARALLRHMKVELPAEEQARFGAAPPVSADAQEVLLRARFLLRHAGEQSIDSAIASFELARALDPAPAEIQSGLAWAYVLSYELGADTSRAPLNSALRAVQSAIAADRSSAEATRAWALVAHYTGEHDRALARLQEAVHLAPADAESQRRLALIAVAAGRPDEALKAAETACSLDPFNVDSWTTAGLVRNYRGQFAASGGYTPADEFDAAAVNFTAGTKLAADRSRYAAMYVTDIAVYRQQHDRAIELLSDRVARERQSALDYYRLGRVLQSGGRSVQEWQAAFRSAKALLSGSTDARALALLALVHTRLGEFREAADMNGRARALAPDDPEVLYATARMYALQSGNSRQALELLNRAVDRRYRLDEVLDMDFFNLRSDPGFLPAITR